MPKIPPDLARLLPSANLADRVQVQQGDFGHDILGRYVCNDWAEVEASIADGGYPFDAVVIGAGMFGAYCAEKLYRQGTSLNLRILVLDAGAFLLPSHIQNLPQRLGGNVGGPSYARTRDDGSHTQNVVWGIPWISNEPFPGLAYCIGGRSLFWGGWSPRLTADDLANWPPQLVSYLVGNAPGNGIYDVVEKEIGVSPVADFMLPDPFHNKLLPALQTAARALGGLTGVEEAPLAVQGSAPGSGIFPFDKFSSAPWVMDAIRDDVATNTQLGDTSRRMFLVPRTQVLRLNVSGNAVTSIDVRTDGQAKTLPVSGNCAVVIATGTIESTRLALESFGIGSTRFGSPRLGNLMAHLRSNITVRIKRTALGLPAAPPSDFETTAFLVRGTAQGRRFHFQVVAAASGGANPEKNLFEQVPDVEIQDQIRANQDPTWITLVFRGIGEMESSRTLDPDPARSWIDLSSETDQFGLRRAYVNLVRTASDTSLWRDMDKAAFDLATALAGGPGNIEYWNGPANSWQPIPPAIDPQTGGFWRDGLGSTHHEAGTLFSGDPGRSVTNVDGRFHGISNAYAAGPAVFPALGSANPSLTALSLARRTADAIIKVATLAPPGPGFAPLSLAPADWMMVAAPGTAPSMARRGPVLETAGGYGLYFYVKEQFANLALWIEWRERHRGDNSGVYVRTPGPNVVDALNQADLQGHEVQIDDSGAPDGAGIHVTGAVYCLQAPTATPVKPLGEWNTYLIETNGGKITVTLNGQVVNVYQSTRKRSGYLALQAHHFPSRIQFRNLQVKKLP